MRTETGLSDFTEIIFCYSLLNYRRGEKKERRRDKKKER